MILTCFCCNATGSIEAFCADSAAADFANLAGNLQPTTWRALLAYIGLFRTGRKLAFGKALRLAQETLALDADHARLEIALIDTVESLRQRGGKPLKNHNYLKRVVENTAAQGSGLRAFNPNPEPQTPSLRSKAAIAIKRLEEWSGDDWLRKEIGMGLSGLVAQNLKFTPAAEIITANADIWYVSLKTLLTIEAVDAPRLWAAFRALVGKLTEWPQPKQLIELLPPRPPRQAIRHELSEGDRVAGIEKMKAIREQFE